MWTTAILDAWSEPMREQVQADDINAGDRIRRGVATYTVVEATTDGGTVRLRLTNSARTSRVTYDASATITRIERAEGGDEC